MKTDNPKPERGSIKWWIHLIIGILSAIAGALGGSLAIAPVINQIF